MSDLLMRDIQVAKLCELQDLDDALHVKQLNEGTTWNNIKL